MREPGWEKVGRLLGPGPCSCSTSWALGPEVVQRKKTEKKKRCCWGERLQRGGEERKGGGRWCQIKIYKLIQFKAKRIQTAFNRRRLERLQYRTRFSVQLLEHKALDSSRRQWLKLFLDSIVQYLQILLPLIKTGKIQSYYLNNVLK